MRRFFRLMMMGLILVVVAVMSALTAMSIAIHGRETTVPNFIKLSNTEAERVALTNGLRIDLEGQFYSADIPEGRIVSQVPAPGTRVRRGWHVRLAQSLGAQRVVIPDLLGQSPRAAELNIRQRGLELGTVAQVQLRDAPPQQIIAQSPPPNAQGILSPKVSVLVAAEPEAQSYIMPSFVGRPLSEAVGRIEQAGFKIGRVSVADAQPQISASIVPTANSLPPIVLKQSPSAGQRITAETPIEFQVSR